MPPIIIRYFTFAMRNRNRMWMASPELVDPAVCLRNDQATHHLFRFGNCLCPALRTTDVLTLRSRLIVRWQEPHDSLSCRS
jgi:hypothetical protein